MGIIFRLIGLPFAVIGGTVNIAHEGIGMAVDSVAKKRRQRNELRQQCPSSGHCPNCMNCERVLPSKAPSYHRADPVQSSEYSTQSPAQLQAESCGAPPSYSPLPITSRTELPSPESKLPSAELPSYEASRPELDPDAPTSKPSELPSRRFSEAVKPDRLQTTISNAQNETDQESTEPEKKSRLPRMAGKLLSVSSSVAVSSLTLGIL
ncbi:MAG: hypothetical protein Q9195_006775 [Heterodermia aff. obscurata]